VYLAASEVLNLYQHPGTTDHPNSYPLRIEAGLQGLITAKLTMNIWIGYGNGFYRPTATVPMVVANPNSVIAGLGLNWKPTTLSTGTLGYTHDFENSLLGSYFDLDMVYLSWTQLMWRFTGFLRFAYSNERFAGVCVPMRKVGLACGPSGETVANRVDNLITLNVRIDYPFKDWLFLSLVNDLQVNVSNGALSLGVAGTVPPNYTKDVIGLRLTASY
jgi:hypothetical protein